MDDHITQFIIEIKTSLASIDTKVSGILDQVRNHEDRIKNIEGQLMENSKSGETGVNKILGKCLYYALIIIASLTGAGALLSKLSSN